MPAQKILVGIDVFVDFSDIEPNDLAIRLQKLNSAALELIMITNRGTKVWPNGFDETFCTDHWRCRFYAKASQSVQKSDILQLLQAAAEQGIDFIKMENLYTFNGIRGFSLGQGE